jgi:Bacteriocin-protection, YdeI or OmpD-Associated/Domain of unknown function (DUF1905)
VFRPLPFAVPAPGRDDERMQRVRFTATTLPGPRGTVVVPVPFNPDQVWANKLTHAVNGTINGHFVRGKLARSADGWALTVSAMWARDCGIASSTTIQVDIAPEGPQRGDLAPDVAAALEANPRAAAFFDTLAQFYTKAYLRWIDSTSRQPALRAKRIAEVIELLQAGIKQRPKANE